MGKSFSSRGDNLRRQAERKAGQRFADTDPKKAAKVDADTLLHELQVHQIELELQNEELVAAQQELSRSQRKYAELFESAPVGYLILDSEARIVELNRMALEILGRPVDKLKGHPLSMCIDRADLAAFMAHRKAVLSDGHRCEGQLRIARADGTVVSAYFVSNPIKDEAGKIIQCRTSITDITQTQTEQRYKSLFEQNLDAVFTVDRQGRITDVNPAMERMCGRRREELFKMTFVELFAAEQQARVWKHFQHGVGGNGTSLDAVMTAKDGRRIDLLITGGPVVVEGQVTGMFGIARDITGRKQAEEALIKSQNQIQGIIDNTPALVYMLDLNERFLLVNKSLADLLNSSLEEMIGKRRHEFMPKDDADRHEENDRKAIKAGKALEFEEYSQLRGHSITWLTTKFPLRDPNGEIYALAGITTDITERKRAAQELERLRDELEYKNEELESIMKIASHDLRSPLVNIKGFAGELTKDIHKLDKMLKGVQLPEDVRERAEMVFNKYVPEALGFIQNSADFINQMLGGLMTVTKAGIAPLAVHDIDMNAVLKKIKANVQFNLKETGSKLSVEQLPPCRADADQMTQVFSNLIGNAIKYREPSRPLHIQIYASAEPNKVTYCVEDNGKGIAAEHLDKVFNLFARLDAEATKGEGLGLTIAKRIVERQGGNIWVNSEVGKGSKFFVSLPK